MNVFKRSKALLSDPLRSQNERVFVMLVLVALLLLFLGFLGDIFYSENVVEVAGILFVLLIVPATQPSATSSTANPPTWSSGGTIGT